MNNSLFSLIVIRKKSIFTTMEKIKIFLQLLVLAVFLTNCTNKSDEYIDPRGTDYAGSESCIQCHQTQYESASHSAHFKATSPATKENILGHFTNGHNTFVYDKNTKLVMEERNDSLYQVLYKNGKEVEAYPFDIIFGTNMRKLAVTGKIIMFMNYLFLTINL